MIESTDKPKFDKKTGFYEIKGKDGKTVKINKDEVVEIKEKQTLFCVAGESFLLSWIATVPVVIHYYQSKSDELA